MLCEKCGKNQATVYLRQVVNGHETKLNLCSECAGGVWGGKNLFDKNMFGLNDFGFKELGFGDFDLNKLFSAGQGGPERLVCDGCGQSLAEFNESGRLGCSRCCQSFAEQLAPVIRRFHGGRRHMGKVKMLSGGLSEGSDWRGDPALADKNYERMALQKQLDELVSAEKFEEAAGVRDHISRLDEEIGRMLNGSKNNDKKNNADNGAGER